ncbi:cytochrome c3 family protein [Heliobacterium mobile]|nr:cytochrome c3 family protein [Heliobacterium mobile]
MSQGIKRLILFSFAFAAFSALVFSVQWKMLPESFYSPGHLAQAHAETVQGCDDCHTPWSNVESENCTTANCHSREMMNKQMTGELLAYHDSKNGSDCIDCHREHFGTTANISSRFDHSLPNIEQSCDQCHRWPKGHETFGKSCAACHTVKAWKPATFSHDNLANLNRRCTECHQGPKDHQAFGDDCASCHTTTAWRPSNFDHSKYFPLVGEHRISCSECHEGGDFKNYSCTSCHSESSMLRRHHSTNYGEIQNCVDCHNSDGRSLERDGRTGGTERYRHSHEFNGEQRKDRSLRRGDEGSYHFGEEHGFEPYSRSRRYEED